MLKQERVQKIGEYSYFIVEQSTFENTIVGYDPRLANLTITREDEALLEIPEEPEQVTTE